MNITKELNKNKEEKEKMKNTRRTEKLKSIKKYAQREKGITLVALVVTILFSYDEKFKFSNSKGFLLQTI